MREVHETSEVRSRHRFDEGHLSAWLTTQIDGVTGPIEVRQFRGGQSNPTFVVQDAGGRLLVVRKKPPGKLLPSAHQVEREYRVMTALAGTDVPVPTVLGLCEDDSVIGTAFYVMDYCEGRVFRKPALPDMTPDQRAAIYDAMNDVLAKLHGVDFAAVGLGDYGRTGAYIQRQVSRWTKQYRASETEPIEAMDQLVAWLGDHIPEADETTIAHCDYRLENMIFHPTEPRVVAVLDWELSTLGHPLSDLAYNCMAWYLTVPELGGLAHLDLAEVGIPSEDEYVAAYCQRTGRGAIEPWNFYMAFSMFRIVAIAQGVYKRSLQGNASSETAAQYGAVAKQLAALGWHVARRGKRSIGG